MLRGTNAAWSPRMSKYAGFLLAVVTACGSAELQGATPDGQGATPEHTALLTEAASTKTEPEWYPKGPFGTKIGDVIADLTFQGKSDENHDGRVSDEPLRTIALADDARHGQSKTRVLVLSECALWCEPCNMEQGQLVELWRDYEAARPGEVQFAAAIAQSVNGLPSREVDVNHWGAQHFPVLGSAPPQSLQVPYDILLDPEMTLIEGYQEVEPSFPFHLVVRAKGMTIAAKVNGALVDDLKAAIDAVLAEPPGQ
jgi:hypothetical protein